MYILGLDEKRKSGEFLDEIWENTNLQDSEQNVLHVGIA